MEWPARQKVRIDREGDVRFAEVVERHQRAARRERRVEMHVRRRIELQQTIDQLAFERRRGRLEQQEQSGARRSGLLTQCLLAQRGGELTPTRGLIAAT